MSGKSTRRIAMKARRRMKMIRKTIDSDNSDEGGEEVEEDSNGGCKGENGGGLV